MNRSRNNFGRISGRYNSPGQFVSAGETQQQSYGNNIQEESMNSSQVQENLQPIQAQNVLQESDGDMSAPKNSQDERPKWMKPKLQGVKKISNKEKRRRQNQTLRRLLTPKNALMILNEMVPHQHVANHFKVEPNLDSQFFSKSGVPTFAAELSLDGTNYKGFGENKLTARNAAAEQAIRDIIIGKMNKALGSEGGEDDDEALPMIQLASFALHKLFAEWEYAGHKVPHLVRHSSSVSDTGSEAGGAGGAGGVAGAGGARSARAARAVPSNAAAMHPCMLLTYLRPQLDYVDLPPLGDKPQNMIFSMQVTVDGQTFIGRGSSKKEARKEAAKQACEVLFGVVFDEHITANAPVFD